VVTIFSVYLIFLTILNIKFPNLSLYNDFNDVKNDNIENENQPLDYFDLVEKLESAKNEYDYLNNLLSKRYAYLRTLQDHITYLNEQELTLNVDVKTYKDVFDLTLSSGDLNKILEDIYPFIRGISDRYLMSLISTDYDLTENQVESIV